MGRRELVLRTQRALGPPPGFVLPLTLLWGALWFLLVGGAFEFFE